MPKVINVAVIVAAGRGERMRLEGGKQYILLGGKPILAHTLQVFEDCTPIHQVIVVANPEDIKFCRHEIVEKYGLSKVLEVVAGGPKRQDSVYNGLQALPEGTTTVIIHDGARPLVTPQIIEKAISALKGWDGVVVGVPATDTIKEVEDERIARTRPRAKLWCAQTPQVFKLKSLLEAHKQAKSDNFYGTDDAILLERMGYRIRMIMGSYENIKITTPEDLIVAEAILKRRQGSRVMSEK